MHILRIVQSPMRDDISELFERLKYCREKCAELEGKIAQLASTSISHWIESWGQPGIGEIRAKLLSNPPVSLREEVGMVVNVQRSILDALACKLAIRNGANNINDVNFPITKEKAGYFEKGGRQRIRKLSADDQAAIESFKPWCPSSDNQEDGNIQLFQLHEADRIKKHQHLLRWACQGGIDPFNSGPLGFVRSGSIIFQDVGKEVSIATFAGSVGEIGLSFRLVYFEQSILMGCSVAPLLSCFNDVVDGIVSHFN